MTGAYRGVVHGGQALLALYFFAHQANAAVYSYVDWTEADVASGSAHGTITLPDESTVDVTFQAVNADGTPGTLHGAQVTGGSNYWSPSAPYISSEVENPPPTPDILQLAGGLNQTYTVALSEPIRDPMMAIVSLGQASVRCTYEFDVPFTIVSQGSGYWGGTDASLMSLAGNVLEGYEGHGTIQFMGTFDAFSWSVPTPESWHGFTFAIRTTERLEPTPSEGGAGGGAGEGGVGNAHEQSEAGGGGDDTAARAGAGGDAGAVAGSSANQAGAAQGGEPSEERPVSRDEPGCNCSFPRAALAPSALGSALLLLGLMTRRARRKR